MQQRSSMPVRTPTIGVQQGSRNHGQNQQFYIFNAPPNQVSSNGISLTGQSQPYQGAHVRNVQPGGFRHPPPTNQIAAYQFGAYPSHEMIPTGPYAPPAVSYIPAQIAAQYPQFVTNQFPTAYMNGGQTFAYAVPGGYPGPTALELPMPPEMAPQPQPPPPPQQQHQAMQVPVAMPTGTTIPMGHVQQQQQPQCQPQQQPMQQPQTRQKSILSIIDPLTGENRMEDLLKEQQTRGSARHGGLSFMQQQQLPKNPYAHQVAGAGLPSGATSSLKQGPPQSRSDTPRTEQPKVQIASRQSASRGPSPALEAVQNDSSNALSEFLTQFSQQLAAPDQADSQAPAEPIQESHGFDAGVIMPPPHIIPQTRSTSTKGPISNPPTPPASSTPIHLSKTTHPVEFTRAVAPSDAASSSVVAKKPKDILGASTIEFGWLDVSAGDKSMDAVDGVTAEPVAFIAQQRNDVRETDYCSTPQNRRPPPPQLPDAKSRDTVTETGRKNEAAPLSPKDTALTYQREGSQSLLIGNAPFAPDAASYAGNGLIAAPSANNASCQQRDRHESLEEGEIRDSTLDHSTGVGCFQASMTSLEMAVALAAAQEIKKLESSLDGRHYSYEFMMSAAKLPSSKKRPQFITAGWTPENVDEVFNLKRQSSLAKIDHMRSRQMMPGPGGFIPSWVDLGMDMAGRKPYPGRTSDTGSMRAIKPPYRHPSPVGRAVSNRPPPLVIARPSIDVELKSSKNAWKPAHKAAQQEDPEVTETKKLLKEVRGILNKITPQSFPELAKEFLSFETRMNTVDRATGVVDVVFQKAVDEPAFCAMYSELYVTMARLQQQQRQADGQENEQSKETSFLRILLTKCQGEFERDKRCETSRKEREMAIDKAETAEEKKQLQDELGDFVQKEKRRTLGNMRFIGELFLKNMLTNKIVHRCVMGLIQKAEDEESLECLCKLLSTIGKKLDADDSKETIFQGQTDGYYKRLQDLARGMSSRIRFMIVDLLELRESAWQPRRKGEGPKTIQQLHDDAAKEKLEKQQELLKEEKKKHESVGQETRGGGRRDGQNRPNFCPPERQDDARIGKGDRDRAGGRDRDHPNRQSGRQGPSAGGHHQQVPQPSADLSKAKAPALSQHLGGMEEGIKFGPQRWNKPKNVANAASIPRQQEPKPTKTTNRFDSLPKSDDVRVGWSPGSRDSSQTRRPDKGPTGGNSDSQSDKGGKELANTAADTVTKTSLNTNLDSCDHQSTVPSDASAPNV